MTILSTAILCIIWLATGFAMGYIHRYRSLLKASAKATLILRRAKEDGQPLFRLQQAFANGDMIYDSGWLPIAEYLLPEEHNTPNHED